MKKKKSHDRGTKMPRKSIASAHDNQMEVLNKTFSSQNSLEQSQLDNLKLRRFSKIIKILILFVVLHWLALAFFLGWSYAQSRAYRYSFTAAPVYTTDLSFRYSKPVSISIDVLKKTLNIEDARIENGIWSTSDTGVSHLDTSARPGEGNNIVLYAHNTKPLFGSLKTIKIGDRITLRNDLGDIYEYDVTNTLTVLPTQIEAVLPTESEQLTLYTCTGLFDSHRFIVQAKPVGVSRN